MAVSNSWRGRGVGVCGEAKGTCAIWNLMNQLVERIWCVLVSRGTWLCLHYYYVSTATLKIKQSLHKKFIINTSQEKNHNQPSKTFTIFFVINISKCLFSMFYSDITFDIHAILKGTRNVMRLLLHKSSTFSNGYFFK